MYSKYNMRTVVLLSIFTVTISLLVSVSAVHGDDDVLRRRETMALFRGFLCYIKGESIEDCKSDRAVTNTINRLEDDILPAEDMPEDIRQRLRPKPSRLQLSSSAYPLPPQEERKRDAFYSDWRRK